MIGSHQNNSFAVNLPNCREFHWHQFSSPNNCQQEYMITPPGKCLFLKIGKQSMPCFGRMKSHEGYWEWQQMGTGFQGTHLSTTMHLDEQKWTGSNQCRHCMGKKHVPLNHLSTSKRISNKIKDIKCTVNIIYTESFS